MSRCRSNGPLVNDCRVTFRVFKVIRCERPLVYFVIFRILCFFVIFMYSLGFVIFYVFVLVYFLSRIMS